MPAPDPQAVALYGEPRDAREPIRAQAGPVQFVFENGMIKHVRLGGIELVRRVYFGVRDDEWDTIYPVFSDVMIQKGPKAFHTSFKATCKKGAVHYIWEGSIAAEADGTIRFTTTGEPVASFKSNRVGLCLLLPARTLAGQPFKLTKPDGSSEAGQFTRFIDPDLVGEQFQAIRYQPPGGPNVECAMHGAIFDMEDQRLYLDTTYKAYAPLPHKYPDANAGERFEQTFTLRLIDRPASPNAVDAQAPVEINVGGPIKDARLPELGLTLNDPELTEQERADLSALELSHLRVAVDLAATDDEQRLQEALRVVPSLTKGLVLSVQNLTDANADRLSSILRHVAASAIERLRLEICDGDAALLPAIRQATTALALDVQIGGPGSIHVSGHPDREAWAKAGAEFLCWAGSPAIHQEDDETLMENTRGIAEQLAHTRQFVQDTPLGMGPFSLDGAWARPRPNPRYTGLFAATWVASAIKHLAESGAAFATLFETTGPTGMLYRQADFDPPGLDGPERSRYPVYDVVRGFSRTRGRLHRADSSDDLRVEALAYWPVNAAEGALTTVLINKTFSQQDVTVTGLPAECVEYRYPSASASDGDSASGQATGRTIAGGSGQVTLEPYELLWLVPKS